MEKEVKQVKVLPQHKDFYFTILNLLKQGKRPSIISKELSISKQRLNFYIRRFKKEGIIFKKGYGVWDVKEVKVVTSRAVPKQVKEIRGHGFIWTIKLNKNFNWLNLLKDNSFRLVNNNKTPRILIKEHKIWLGKKTITIYDNKSFYGKNSIESRKYAIITLLEVIQAIESKLGINLRPYVFKPTREHYGMVKNELARQYNRSNEKMVISDDIEGNWLWIDDSESLGELETKNIVRSKQVQEWWNNQKKHDFKVNADFILNVMATSQQQLTQFSKQIESHLKLIQEYRKENIAWRKGKIAEIRKDLKEGEQTTLF